MDIGTEIETYIIEPLESPVPGVDIPAPSEPSYDPEPAVEPSKPAKKEKELVPA